MAKNTRVQLAVSDENLEFTSSPNIYSGDVNTIEIQFEFDEYWENYVKYAVFYTDVDNPYTEKLDTEGVATFPHEVMQEPGRVYIGVFGSQIGDDEAKLKTSEVVFYDIGQGIFGKASQDTANMWEEILMHFDEIRNLHADTVAKSEVATQQANIATEQAGIATQKASDASESASDASDSATVSASSATAAKASEDAAKESEDNASASATAAADSATEASGYATNASNAKSAAETARDEAVQAAEEAKAIADLDPADFATAEQGAKADTSVQSVNGKTPTAGDVELTLDDFDVESITEPINERISNLINGEANTTLTGRKILSSDWLSLDDWMGENGDLRLGVWSLGSMNYSDMPDDAVLDLKSLLYVYKVSGNPNPVYVFYLYALNGIYSRAVMKTTSGWNKLDWYKVTTHETLCLNLTQNTINVSQSTSSFIKQLEMHFPNTWNGKKALITVGPIFCKQDDAGTFGIKYRIGNSENIGSQSLVVLQNNTGTDMCCKRLLIDIPEDAQDYVFELGFTKSSGTTRVTGYSVTAISLN